MSLKNVVCTTVDPAVKASVDPNTGIAHKAGICIGTVLPYENIPITVNGKLYQRYEQCQRCGQVFPG